MLPGLTQLGVPFAYAQQAVTGVPAEFSQVPERGQANLEMHHADQIIPLYVVPHTHLYSTTLHKDDTDSMVPPMVTRRPYKAALYRNRGCALAEDDLAIRSPASPWKSEPERRRLGLS